VSQFLRDRGIDVPLRNHSIPQEYLSQGKRAEVMAEIGLTAQDVARHVVEAVAGLGAPSQAPAPVITD
jgi:1-deoxy-D-xylulose-5-phosphate synthase